MDYPRHGRAGGLCLDFFLDLPGHVHDVYSSPWLLCKCLLSLFSLYTFVLFLHGHTFPFTDCPNYSISVAADAEEELLDTSNRESACGMNNKPTLTTSKKTLTKMLMALRPTEYGLEILLLWMLRTVVIACMTFRDWRGLCALLEWLEIAR